MSGNRPVLWVGRMTQRLGRRLRRKHPPAEDLPERFLVQRNLVRRAFGSRWWEAVAGASARWVLDYVTLLTALAAVGQHPRPVAGPARLLRGPAAGADPDHARRARRRRGGTDGHAGPDRRPGRRGGVATLAYRLINYWLALPIGGAAWLWHRRKVRAGAVSVPRPARA